MHFSSHDSKGRQCRLGRGGGNKIAHFCTIFKCTNKRLHLDLYTEEDAVVKLARDWSLILTWCFTNLKSSLHVQNRQDNKADFLTLRESYKISQN